MLLYDYLERTEIVAVFEEFSLQNVNFENDLHPIYLCINDYIKCWRGSIFYAFSTRTVQLVFK